jgi:hypothetical protein
VTYVILVEINLKEDIIIFFKISFGIFLVNVILIDTILVMLFSLYVKNKIEKKESKINKLIALVTTRCYITD